MRTRGADTGQRVDLGRQFSRAAGSGSAPRGVELPARSVPTAHPDARRPAARERAAALPHLPLDVSSTVRSTPPPADDTRLRGRSAAAASSRRRRGPEAARNPRSLDVASSLRGRRRDSRCSVDAARLARPAARSVVRRRRPRRRDGRRAECSQSPDVVHRVRLDAIAARRRRRSGRRARRRAQLVVAVPAVEHVVAEAAVHHVGARARREVVVAASPRTWSARAGAGRPSPGRRAGPRGIGTSTSPVLAFTEVDVQRRRCPRAGTVPARSTRSRRR